MEVTRTNFKETIPLVEKSIKEADFLVIDAEFTGLNSGRDVSLFDTPEEYYKTLFSGASEFLLIQFGLCAFYWDEKTKGYMNDSYNFYLFPRGRPGPEKIFLCQSSSLDFLASQGFDFNKLIRQGISYMTEPTETRLRESLTERQKLYSNDKDIIDIPEVNKQYIEEICERVKVFLDKKQENEMEIDKCNAFIRRLLFQEIGSRFKKEAFVETKVLENQNRILKVSRLTSENESVDREAAKKEKEWEEFEEAVGFSKVARMISQSEKLVVGHNMLLDVIHTLSHFFQPLPPDYKEFKDFAHCMFPRLLDTKYMSSLPPFKDKVNSSVLGHLYATLSETPFKVPNAGSKEGRGYNHADDKEHEAGYDAYITGLCFLSMHSHLANMRGEKNVRVTNESAILKPFYNKLFLARTAHQDSPYMNLAGQDPTPPRDHVFYLNFPKEWQRNDINQLFSPYGPITVQFLDDASALIALSRRDQAKDVFKTMSKSSSVSIMPFLKYKTVVAKIQSHHDKTSRETSEQTNNMIMALRSRLLGTKSVPTLKRKLDTPTKISRTPPNSDVNTPQTNSTPNIDIGTPVERTPVSINESIGDSDGNTNKAERVRSNSLSSPTRIVRKRTSSGMVQKEDTEPPPKKPEVTRKPAEVVSNGHRKEPKTPELKPTSTNAVTNEYKKSENAPKCVKAFQESDNWD